MSGQLSAGSGEGQSVPWESDLWSVVEREEVSNQTDGCRVAARVMRRAHPLPSKASVEESVHVERGGAAEHVVGGTAKTCGEDTEGLTSSVLGAEALDEFLAAWVPPKESDGGLTVGPLEMGVADFVAGVKLPRFSGHPQIEVKEVF